MTNYETPADLRDALTHIHATPPMTREQVEAQRRSWVRGQCDVTDAEIDRQEAQNG